MTSPDFARSCGVLLHPTSLPGPSGIGDLGAEAYRFVDFLASAGQGIWQVLPLGPVGRSNSPYDSSSAFAGNPLLISESWLVQYGLLKPSDVPPELHPSDKVDFEAARARKLPMLRAAFEHFEGETDSTLARHFDEFRHRQSSWLEDFALFQSLGERFAGLPWSEWDAAAVRREPEILKKYRHDLSSEIRFHAFVQFVFDEQWHALRRYAAHHGVRMMGDIPIYVSLNSADVWSNQCLFELDQRGRPTVVAGVPPDYFSATGQRWGNPCYRWGEVARDEYRWWSQRFKRASELYDLVRVDHFRAFQAGWQIPCAEETAINGRWVAGPGADLFERLGKELEALLIVVEDLGIITDEVTELRKRLGLPGMKVLQFAFGGDSANPHLPHNYDANCVVYTGTHDNDTSAGWFTQIDSRTREHVERYLGFVVGEIAWRMIGLAYGSVAKLAMVPAQDLLGLGSEHRMNVPGTAEGDWEWRMRADALSPEIAQRLRDLAGVYGRSAGVVSGY